MGQSSSNLKKELLEEYASLTFLSKSEILHLYKAFSSYDINYRFNIEQIEEFFTQLRCNPFRDRIYQVFSSERDNCFSFEDILDLCSVMSEKCPDTVKAAWAFRIFDFDEDDAVGAEDIALVIDRLTNASISGQRISDSEKEHIIKVVNKLFQEIDLEKNGKINQLEFEHAVGKMSEFAHSFCFRF